MNHDVSRRLALEEQIHGALERQEFEVFYQSKVAIDSGRIIGAEALLRWYNPVLGDMPVDDFRKYGHQMVDWIADYLEGIENADLVFVSQVWFKYPQNMPSTPITTGFSVISSLTNGNRRS